MAIARKFHTPESVSEILSTKNLLFTEKSISFSKIVLTINLSNTEKNLFGLIFFSENGKTQHIGSRPAIDARRHPRARRENRKSFGTITATSLVRRGLGQRSKVVGNFTINYGHQQKENPHDVQMNWFSDKNLLRSTTTGLKSSNYNEVFLWIHREVRHPPL